MKQQFEYQFLRLPEVMEMTSLSKSRIYDLMSRNLFPKNISLGRRTAVWVRKDIEEWCKQKAGVCI
tara:strand:+ start:196 stop:393 length:198 start_codon:yes stop_codon:yes gene_type:complete